jgi:peptide/nickel transport system permease protein
MSDPVTRLRSRPAGLTREVLRSTRLRIGLVIFFVVVACAIIGPYVAPHNPTAFVGRPFGPPTSTAVLGTDYVGRDVLSRFLSGGRTILELSVLATLLDVGVGTCVALVAGYSLKVGDEVLMRSMDLLLAFPPIVLALVAVSIVGPAAWLIILVVGVSQMPQTARVMRSAVVQVRDLDFVKYAEAIGVSRWRILKDQLLPNVVAPLMVELGLRLTFAIGLIASLDYLGLGTQPPAADWGLMIQENQTGLSVTPWPVLIPIVAIALLTIGSNLATDGVARIVAGVDRTVDA